MVGRQDIDLSRRRATETQTNDYCGDILQRLTEANLVVRLHDESPIDHPSANRGRGNRNRAKATLINGGCPAKSDQLIGRYFRLFGSEACIGDSVGQFVPGAAAFDPPLSEQAFNKPWASWLHHVCLDPSASSQVLHELTFALVRKKTGHFPFADETIS